MFGRFYNTAPDLFLIKPGITTKLFLTLITTIFVVIGVLLWWVSWSFDRGFIRYVNREDERRAEIVASFLEGQYRLYGGWEFLRGQNRSLQLIARNLTAPLQGPGRGMGLGMRPPSGTRADTSGGQAPPPPEAATGDTRPSNQVASRRPMGAGSNRESRASPREEGVPLPERLSLYDAEGSLVARNFVAQRGDYQRPLFVDDTFVGSLWLFHQDRLTDDFDVQFSDQQNQANILIAMALFCFSIVVSLLLSRNLLRTVRQVTAGARELAAGHWSSRINVDSSDELGQLARDFNDLAKVLEANEQSRRQWIADISHELRTPITILIGEIEAIMEGAREASEEALQSLHDEANRMKTLVGDLYHLALSDIGALDYRKQWVWLHDIVQNVIDHFADRFAEAGIELQFESSPGPHAKLYGDPDRLRQLLSNLLQNCARYTDPGGQCLIGMNERADGIYLTIDDSAPGVPEEALAHLFDRLYRVESSRNRATGGAGLGLAISANIVHGHDGTIEATASELGGLRLNIFFPYRAPLT